MQSCKLIKPSLMIADGSYLQSITVYCQNADTIYQKLVNNHGVQFVSNAIPMFYSIFFLIHKVLQTVLRFQCSSVSCLILRIVCAASPAPECCYARVTSQFRCAADKQAAFPSTSARLSENGRLIF